MDSNVEQYDIDIEQQSYENFGREEEIDEEGEQDYPEAPVDEDEFGTVVATNPLKNDKEKDKNVQVERVLYEQNQWPIEEVKQNIIIIYRSNNRSPYVTLCGAVNLIPEAFWKKLTAHGIKFQKNNDTLCFDIILKNAPRVGMNKKVLPGKLAEDVKHIMNSYIDLENFLNETNIVWSKIEPGIVGISQKPLDKTKLMMCGDVGIFSKKDNAMKKQLNEWAEYDFEKNCWVFDKNMEARIVNFMKGHGWKVRYAGEIVEELWGPRMNQTGVMNYAGKYETIADRFGNLHSITKKQQFLPPRTPVDPSNLPFQRGDIVVWEEGDGAHKGLVEAANNKYFEVKDTETNQVLYPIDQESPYKTIGKANTMFKVIERYHPIADFPTGTAISATNIRRGKVWAIENSMLLVETYDGTIEYVSQYDPNLRIINIDISERAKDFRPRMNIKYRLTGTKEWEYAKVSKVLDASLEVMVFQNHLEKGDGGLLSSKSGSVAATIIGKYGKNLEFRTAENLSLVWRVGEQIQFDHNGNNFIFNIVGYRPNALFLIAKMMDDSVLAPIKKTISLDCLSLTIIKKKEEITHTGFINFTSEHNQQSQEERKKHWITLVRQNVRSKFENLISQFYQKGREGTELGVSLDDAAILEENLFQKHNNPSISTQDIKKLFNTSGDEVNYLMQAMLLIMALDSTDNRIGKYTYFFRAHVSSEMFKFRNLHKADINHIIPEIIDNPNLGDQYGEAVGTLRGLVEENIKEQLYHVKRMWTGKEGGPIIPYKGSHLFDMFNSLEKYVANDLKSLCSNVGSAEIPEESLVFCFENGQFYCFAVQDIILNIKKADEEKYIPYNPFTGEAFEEVFIKRMREMFMDTEEARSYYNKMEPPNRTYNLVPGDIVSKEMRVEAIKGITISELIAINPLVKNQKFEYAASDMLQTLAIYVVQKMIQESGEGNRYLPTDSMLKLASIFLSYGTDKIWKQVIIDQIVEDLNKAKTNQSFVTGKLNKNDIIYMKFLYAEELLSVEQKAGKGIETSESGLVVLGSLIYSLLQLTINSAMHSPNIVNDVISAKNIDEGILNNENLKQIFSDTLYKRGLVSTNYNLFGEDLSDSESEEPSKKIITPPRIITQAGDVVGKKINYRIEDDIVKSLFNVHPILYDSTFNKKKLPQYKYSQAASHNIYKIINLFVKAILQSADNVTITTESIKGMVMIVLNALPLSPDFKTIFLYQ